MPVLFQDPDKKKREEGKQQRTSTQVLGGESQSALGGSAGQQQGGGTKSGSFTNLQSYLKAAEGQDFGGEVGGRVRGALSEGEKARAGEREKFGQEVAKGTTKYDEGFVTSTLDKPVGIDEDTKKKFSSYLNAEYKGPKEYSYDPTAESNKAYQKGQDYASMSVNPEKRGTLLGEMYDRPQGYTRGQKSLDTLLLGRDPQSFAGIGEQAQAQQEQLQQFKDQSQQMASNAAAETAATRASTREALGVDKDGNIIEGAGTLGGLESQLRGDLSTAEAQRATGYNELKEALASGDITPEQAQMLGIEEGFRTWGLSPAEALQYSGADPTLQTLSSAEDQAKLNALYGLGDLQGSPFEAGVSQEAGTYDPTKSYGFDTNYRDLVKQRGSEYYGKLGEAGQAAAATGQKSKWGDMSIVQALNAGKPEYDQAIEMVSQYPNDASLQAMFMPTILNYQKLMQAKSGLQSNYGYWDSLK